MPAKVENDPNEWLEFQDGNHAEAPLYLQRRMVFGLGRHKDPQNKKALIYTSVGIFELLDSIKDLRKILGIKSKDDPMRGKKR